jgi:hypothetical protein
MTGQQALGILASDAMKDFREKHGKDIPVLVEGRVGIIKAKADKSAQTYIEKLKEAGATGAIIGGGLVPDEANKSPLEALIQAS